MGSDTLRRREKTPKYPSKQGAMFRETQQVSHCPRKVVALKQIVQNYPRVLLQAPLAKLTEPRRAPTSAARSHQSNVGKTTRYSDKTYF